MYTLFSPVSTRVANVNLAVREALTREAKAIKPPSSSSIDETSFSSFHVQHSSHHIYIKDRLPRLPYYYEHSKADGKLVMIGISQNKKKLFGNFNGNSEF